MRKFNSLFLKIFIAINIFFSLVLSEQSTLFIVDTSDSHESDPEVSPAPAIKSKSLDDETNTRIIIDNNNEPNSQTTTNKRQPQAPTTNKNAKQTSSSGSLVETSSSSASNHETNHSDEQQQQHNSTINKKNDNVEHAESTPPEHQNQDEINQRHQSTSPSSTDDRHKMSSSMTMSEKEPGGQVQADEGRRRETTDARKIDEESQVAPMTKPNVVIRSYQQAATSQQERTRSVTPSTNNYNNNDNNNSNHEHDDNNNHEPSSPSSHSKPKTEDRLLISISSDEDDDTYKQPHKVTSGGQHQDESQHNTHAPQQNPKRKPAITISIQDANIGKQISGGSGSSAVIVRPGEDGQSIVIATVSQSNNKFNNQRPPQTTSGSSPSGGEQPYREPVNNPIQNIINQHVRPSSTTRRPLGGDDYANGAQSNHPVTSSPYSEPYRPPPISNERPQRPTGSEELQGSGTGSSSSYDTRPPPSRPSSRPNQNQESVNGGYGGGGGGGGQEGGGGYDPHAANTNRPIRDEVAVTQSPLASKYPLNEKNCGLVHETRIVGGEEADPDDFLWMAAIIKSKPKEGEARPFCGGSLITRRHVLTAAHCLDGLAPRDVLIRLGSYDFDDSTASSLSADFAIDQFRVPAQYSKKTHTADIAIMRLKTPLMLTDNYKTVCMPQARRSYVGALGTVTGYGSQSQTFRRAAPKLRQVTVPIWENRKCSVVYKRNLTESFLCAGYEEGGKDACQGDSGGPLMTEGQNERMSIVGVVSHGIGCGSPGYPGVYTRTSTYLDWIDKNTQE